MTEAINHKEELALSAVLAGDLAIELMEKGLIDYVTNAHKSEMLRKQIKKRKKKANSAKP